MGYTEYDRWEFYSVLTSDRERERVSGLAGEGEYTYHVCFFFTFLFTFWQRNGGLKFFFNLCVNCYRAITSLLETRFFFFLLLRKRRDHPHLSLYPIYTALIHSLPFNFKLFLTKPAHKERI